MCCEHGSCTHMRRSYVALDIIAVKRLAGIDPKMRLLKLTAGMMRAPRPRQVATPQGGCITQALQCHWPRASARPVRVALGMDSLLVSRADGMLLPFAALKDPTASSWWGLSSAEECGAPMRISGVKRENVSIPIMT